MLSPFAVRCAKVGTAGFMVCSVIGYYHSNPVVRGIANVATGASAITIYLGAINDSIVNVPDACKKVALLAVQRMKHSRSAPQMTDAAHTLNQENPVTKGFNNALRADENSVNDAKPTRARKISLD